VERPEADAVSVTNGSTTPSMTAGPARYLGARVARVEDARLLTGHGTYVDDIVRPGMLHACFVRSPLARARIVAIDTSHALSLAGVHAVFTADDLNPGVHEAWYSQVGKGVPDTPRPPLAEGEVRFVGDLVALVIAEDRYVAEDAADLVDVEYEPLPAVVDYTRADVSEYLVHAGWEHNVAGQMGGRPADTLTAVFDAAAVVVDETIYQQAYVASPMETRGLVVEWSRGVGELTVWAASQAPHDLRLFAARLLGLPENRIRVIARDTGGAFGQKINAHREDVCLLLAARKVPASIKYIEDRRENLMASSSRRENGRVRMAFDEDGTLLAATIDHVQDVGAYPVPWPVGVAMAVGLIFPGPYRFRDAAFTTKCVLTNTPGRTAYRGPWQFETVAREMLLDIAARRMGMDPADLRRHNMLRQDELPFANANGMPLSNMTPLETFEKALDMLDYDGFRREQAAARAAGRYLGVGTASYVEPTATAMPHHGSEGATIRVEPTGAVNVYLAGGSAGNSLETTALQLTADALGVDIAMVHTIQGDTALTPFGSGTGGSRSGSMVAGAVRETAAILRQRIATIAAHVLEASPDDIVVADGGASVKGSPASRLSMAEIAEIAYFGQSKLPADMPLGLEASARYRAESFAVWANATHACTCEVDIDTGQVTLLRYVVAEDCGPMINPNVVEGQIAGGAVQGIGGALLEEFAWDDDGNPLATTFVDYLLPTATEVPIIEYGHIEGSPGPGAGGFKGVGEGGAIAAPAAVANAVADALAPLGITVTRLPLTPAAIVALVDEANAREDAR
jgi:aerobic carbon-monoxide dehydrogenase large subunit